MTSVTQVRRGRPRVQTLDNVIEQAIALVEDSGSAGLTMSALASRLGVGTMTLYRYVPSREGLVDLMVARLLLEQPKPPIIESPTPWVDILVDHMSALRTWAITRPALLSLMKERPRLTEEVARRIEGDLEALARLGFSPHMAVMLQQSLAVQLHGQLEYEMLLRQRTPFPVEPGPLPARLSEAHHLLQTTDLADLYAVGVRALLTGFAHHLLQA